MPTNFKKDLERGHAGEAIICKTLGLIRLDGRGADLRCGKSGLLYEIKSDYYCPWKYPNFFMESISVDHTGALGGPYQAQQKGIDRFVYYFIKAGFAYEFKTDELVAALEKGSWGPQVAVRNGRYNTLGHKVNRKKLIKMLEYVKILLLEDSHEAKY